MKMCQCSVTLSGLLWKVSLSLDMMNGDGMDRYCRVAFLLWRNEKLAGYMMVTELEGLEIGVCWSRMGKDGYFFLILYIYIFDWLMTW